MAELLWTIGHSTHTQLQLVQLLKQNNINLLIDVRTIPRSGKNPQFNKDTLSEDLPQQHGIKYIWLGKELGGLRRRNKELHVNDGWENLSFRGACLGLNSIMHAWPLASRDSCPASSSTGSVGLKLLHVGLTSVCTRTALKASPAAHFQAMRTTCRPRPSKMASSN